MNMRRGRRGEAATSATTTAGAVLEDPALLHLRDEVDPDPLVEALTDRLRRQFPGSLTADEWGRPVAYRHVVRTALSALPPHVTRELAQRLAEDPPADLEVTPAPVDYIDLRQPSALVSQGVGWPG